MIEQPYEAVYVPTGLSQYDGNPLIEALPPINSDEDVVRLVQHFPPLPTAAELALPSKVRAHCVNRVHTAVMPMELHLQFEGAFSQLIRHGYTARHPFNRDTVAMLHATTDEQLRYSGFKSSASSLTVVGLSGMGKTTMLDAVVKLYPQVIYHSSYNGRVFINPQVVWLKIECPHDGSMRGLCASFLAALDLAIGTEYSAKYLKNRVTISVLMQRVSQLCRTYFIGALIIDELQNLNAASEGIERERILNFFVTLSNDAGVPIVLSGTNAMFKLFSRVVRNARRALGMGEFYFDRFSVDDPEWHNLVAFLWRYNWALDAEPFSDGIQAKIYDLVQGNTDFLVKLLTLAQRHAVQNECRLSGDLLQQVYDSQMTILHKPIEALRSRDADQINDFEDLMPAKDQVAVMMNDDIRRRARRVDSLLRSVGHTGSELPAARVTGEPVNTPVVPVPPSGTRSKAAEIVETDDWEAAMKEKGLTGGFKL